MWKTLLALPFQLGKLGSTTFYELRQWFEQGGEVHEVQVIPYPFSPPCQVHSHKVMNDNMTVAVGRGG